MMMNPGAKEAHQSGDMPKESANGRVARWLAGDEWMAVLTSARGKKTVKGKIFLAIAPFYRRRRERESLARPLGMAMDVDVEPDRRSPWHASVSPFSGD
jgi:hypothetical protein